MTTGISIPSPTRVERSEPGARRAGFFVTIGRRTENAMNYRQLAAIAYRLGVLFLLSFIAWKVTAICGYIGRMPAA